MNQSPALPKARKLALIVIDMAEGDRHQIAWDRGPAEEGIMKLASLVGEAGRLGVRTIFVANKSHPALLCELAAVGKGAPLFQKEWMSAFGEKAFDDHLERQSLDGLIIGGWVRHLCVRETVIDAIRREYQVLVSEDILFHRVRSEPFPMMQDAELRLNSRLLTMFPDSGSLLAAIPR